MLKIVKFGGTSLATAEQLAKVKNIVESDPSRRVIVPSAPGKAHKDDTKVTDLLYLVHELASMNQAIDQVWNKIMARFNAIISELGLVISLEAQFKEIKQKLLAGVDVQYMASRGEALNGIIVAAYLDAEYVDAAEVVRISSNGRADKSSYDLIKERCTDKNRRYVIPGFYGTAKTGEIVTFSRGGSDVTGAIVSNALDADVYENWTDVSGFLMTDPRIVADAKKIKYITYTELRELSYMGAGVLHEEAVFPIREKSIPINIRNTNKPEENGTLIVADRDSSKHKVVGIAGQKGFSVFYIEKAMMNEEVGFGRRVLDIFEHHGVSYEHMPSGIDTISVVVKTKKIEGKRDIIEEDFRKLDVDNLKVLENMSLIATVGKGMNHVIGLAASLFQALADDNINIRMIDQGSSEQNIIVGVQEKDYEKAIKAIYRVVA